MKKESKIYVAGHNGLVGSAIIRKLRQEGYNNIITRTHAELDGRIISYSSLHPNPPINRCIKKVA
jgi:nucleoside-diphosphate-sugar epimerase